MFTPMVLRDLEESPTDEVTDRRSHLMGVRPVSGTTE
jgi:hypothetical protein